jgi:NADPH-dependent 2,4-dienoyl-CoA reductase/sulfur reductase-like enzyme/nitrite reductase/ring-hydroxylating ferredoxin subunit
MSHKEYRIAKTTDLEDGQMKGYEVADHKILLRKIDGKYYAGVGKCPHYGASLDGGAMSRERIVCPWHHAAFDVKTGDLREPPAIDSLPQYEVKIDGDDVVVMLPEELPQIKKPVVTRHDAGVDERTFVILGAGAAGNAAAETLRNDGFGGRLVMITKEEKMPYDRPDLTKLFLRGNSDAETVPLRDKDFYKKRDIELVTGKRARGVDTEQNRISFDDGDTMNYDALLLALGARPRKLDLPGADLENVFTIRSLEDAGSLVEAAKKARRAVVVGASFIGLETASSLRERDLPVTVVAPEETPLEQTIGPEVGRWLHRRHEEQGTVFHLGSTVSRIEGEGKVERVVTNDGQTYEADLVIFGVGVDPASDVLQGIEFQTDGSVEVDKHFRAGDGLYAVGDIACFPDWRTGEQTRIEHWRTAEQQGRIAAHNMAGKETPYRSVPFFWTLQAGMHLRYVGHATEWDEIFVDGNIDEGKFIAYYVKDDRILAAAGTGRDADMAALEELMRLDRMPSLKELRDGEVDLVKRVAVA